MKVAIDVRKSLEKNAEAYFEKAKKSRKKKEGALKALEKSKQKLAKIEASTIQQTKSLESRKRVKREWYEKFRWFVSSDGLLVIGGRDATTNEIVIKKYAESQDVVFHTDMAGSPFVVVKGDGKDIPESTLKEAADFTLAYSRAWKAGLQTAAVFYVNPDQVSKEAKAGEYLPKGSFMIYGETHYVDASINFAVGIYDGKIMGGPVSAMKKNCEKIVEMQQGRDKTSDVAKKVKVKLGGELDDIVRVIPAGGVKII